MTFGSNSNISQHPSWNYPWIELSLCFYDTNGSDSFFTHGKGDGTHAGPAIYFDGEYVCSPDYELAWPGSEGTGNSSGLDDERGYNSWWRNTYNVPSNSGSDYTVKFYDPRKDGGRFYVTVVIYARKLKLEWPHYIRIKGYWKTNNEGTVLVNKEFTVNTLSSSQLTKPTGMMMTDYSHFTMNGNLYSSYGPTWVGTSTDADGYNYVAPDALGSKQQYSQGVASFNDLSLIINRDDYYNPVEKPVENVVKRTVSDRGDF